MTRRRWRLVVSLLISSLAAAANCAQSLPSLPVPPQRETVVKVTVDGAPGIAYTLFVPKTYDKDKPVAVLFASSPLGNARPLALNACREVGWISVGLPHKNDIRVVEDVRRRFTVMPRGLYFAGFSEGARFLGDLTRVLGWDVGGIIDIDMGFHGDDRPDRPVAFLLANAGNKAGGGIQDLLMGEWDSPRTRWETVFIFNGGHSWGPNELHDDALRWLASVRSEPGFLEQDP
jgi:hypothetical protein